MGLLENVWMREPVHELYLAQHGLAGLSALVHLQHQHLTSSLVLHLREGGREGGRGEGGREVGR